MRILKWTLLTLIALIALGFLHYTLPQRDIVRINDTYERRVDFGLNAWFYAAPDVGNAAAENRDVFFIQGIRENGAPIVYRNEDTGWGWPPYFKVNSSNLQARVSDLISTRDAPVWVAVTHYGWRNELLSIHPNAVRVREVASPDVRLVPWVNIVILAVMAGIFLWIWRLWRRFRRRRIDPMLEDLDEASDAARGRLSGFFNRFRRRSR